MISWPDGHDDWITRFLSTPSIVKNSPGCSSPRLSRCCRHSYRVSGSSGRLLCFIEVLLTNRVSGSCSGPAQTARIPQTLRGEIKKCQLAGSFLIWQPKYVYHVPSGARRAKTYNLVAVNCCGKRLAVQGGVLMTGLLTRVWRRSGSHRDEEDAKIGELISSSANQTLTSQPLKGGDHLAGLWAFLFCFLTGVKQQPGASVPKAGQASAVARPHDYVAALLQKFSCPLQWYKTFRQ